MVLALEDQPAEFLERLVYSTRWTNYLWHFTIKNLHVACGGLTIILNNNYSYLSLIQ